MNSLFLNFRRWIAAMIAFAMVPAMVASVAAQQKQQAAAAERIHYDFSGASDRWEMMDPECWDFRQVDSNGVLSLHRKQSSYQPPVRSPLHIALLKDVDVGSFQLDVRVRSTNEDYNHRDVCLFFGFQSPSEFYYVHLGKRADPHANQIFIVNQKPRTKISLTTTEGTPWDDQWHHVRIVRDSQSGDIKVYFDDMDQAAMTARDKTFITGRVGVGSFDDTADFDDFELIKQ